MAGADDDVELVQEVPTVICPRLPYSPSAEERRLHRIMHWPFRSWCPECVMGRGRESPHKYISKPEGEPDVHLVSSFDYMLLDCVLDVSDADDVPGR